MRTLLPAEPSDPVSDATDAPENARLFQQVQRELVERRHTEAVLTAQKGVLERIARGARLSEVLPAIVRMVEEQSVGTLCAVLILDDEGCLRLGAAPSLPIAYHQAVQGTRVAASAVARGGNSAYRPEPINAAELEADRIWAELREQARAHGLNTCWFRPITSAAGAILGVVGTYSREAREPRDTESALAEPATHLAGIAIERARTEGALRQNETLLRAIIETEPECVKLVDANGALLHMNQAGLRMIEAESFLQVAGESVYALIASEHHEQFRRLNERVFRGETVTLQFEIIGLQGTRRWMETHAVPLRDAEGTITAQLAVTRDISERKRDEEELRRQAVELAERDRMKDEFLAMLAHELRNPLAPVLNAVEILKARGNADPLLCRQASVIDRQSRHMARLLEDLLDVSRITRGKIALRRHLVDLKSAVEQVVESSRPLLQHHAFSTSLPTSPALVYGDPTRIHQVIDNLLGNAIKFTEPGGRIRLSLAVEAEAAVLRVADSGAGIEPQFLAQVFELFAQADRSAARSEGGLGIGLTLVKRIMELHGGTVEVRSAGSGAGSEFTLRWPLAGSIASDTTSDSDGPVERSSPLAPAAPAAQFRLLVVDDNRDAAETLADLARLWGHAVRTAYGGATALQAAAESRPDVVLCDISMPGMDGYEVAHSLRRLPGLTGVRLIALTGYGQAEDRRRGLEAGFDHHVTKPVDPEALRALFVSLPPSEPTNPAPDPTTA